MKTKIYNPIVIAALSILSLTANAQNTKSYNASLRHDHQLLASAERKSSILTVKNDLDTQLSKIAEYVKFTPKSDKTEYTGAVEFSYWTNLLKELEPSVKYTPEATSLIKYEQEMLAEEISNELTPLVKFNPAESQVIQQYELKDKFAGILKELEAEVKYKPTTIQ